MKKNIFLIVTALLFVFSANVNAQKMVLKQGDLKFLKGETSLNIQYDYAGMRVGKYSDEEYVAKKTGEYNKKEEGKGDTWAERWYADRELRFEPKFEALFSKYILAKKVVDARQNNDGAKYTMIFKTVVTEPGFFLGFTSQPAYINAEVVFIEAGNPDKVLAVIQILKAPGNTGADWDAGERIKEAYAKSGKSLAKFLLKKKAF